MNNISDEFTKEIQLVKNEISGFVDNNQIILFYDECNAPILDINILEDDSLEFYFRLSSKKFIVKGKEIKKIQDK